MIICIPQINSVRYIYIYFLGEDGQIQLITNITRLSYMHYATCNHVTYLSSFMFMSVICIA